MRRCERARSAGAPGDAGQAQLAEGRIEWGDVHLPLFDGAGNDSRIVIFFVTVFDADMVGNWEIGSKHQWHQQQTFPTSVGNRWEMGNGSLGRRQRAAR